MSSHSHGPAPSTEQVLADGEASGIGRSHCKVPTVVDGMAQTLVSSCLGRFLSVCVSVSSGSVMSDSFETLWTAASQAPLSVGLFGREHWQAISGVRSSLSGVRVLVNTAVGCRFLFQRVFSTQGWNPHLLSSRADSVLWSH